VVNDYNKNNAMRIKEIEAAMSMVDFWNDKDKAQALIKELNALKQEEKGIGKYDSANAVITIFSGAGGDDAEDFSAMLFRMYVKFIESRGWLYVILHKHENDKDGFRNITFEVIGKMAYGELKNESGVHRLVRISPFNAKKLRHTSFSMVEITPKFKKGEVEDLPENEVKYEFAKSGGPGGQNVNKRETAVRAVHIPTNISVHVDSERSQMQNREKALEILRGKVYKYKEGVKEEERGSFSISKTTQAEWGSQIRSYVLHPYKMVKDHRTGVEVHDVEAVLERGELDKFIEAERELH